MCPASNKKFLEEVQHDTIVMPPFVDWKYQSTASMLTGDSSKINLECPWQLLQLI